ncbi:MAG TPA: urate hydroxylase PuuD, partial [Candidatus Elarobacter sp.]|nr:urate hydroxylase PuuD [Candidatus Elarobacter sp.]
MNGQLVLDWLNLVARWAHLIAGISWIGASFYFVWLDDSLTAPESADDVRRGMSGELWAVHGGGFYHNQKYLTGPRGEPLTENLHWFKWEAYSTWITGMAMLAIVYWAGASSYLIDRSVLDLTPPAAITISIASLVIGWLVYDGLCRALGSRPAVLWTAVVAFLLFADWALFHIFGGRAAYVHVGAIIGTIMVANVFFVVIPGQKRMLAQIRAGREPDPRPGR